MAEDRFHIGSSATIYTGLSKLFSYIEHPNWLGIFTHTDVTSTHLSHGNATYLINLLFSNSY